MNLNCVQGEDGLRGRQGIQGPMGFRVSVTFWVYLKTYLTSSLLPLCFSLCLFVFLSFSPLGSSWFSWSTW